MKALLGGTFNPPHSGHVAVALAVMAAIHPQQVEFIPSFQPVHRDEPDTCVEDRRQMVALAIADFPALLLNPLEIERGGPSYTVETLEALAEREPETRLCWIMGGDAFNGFERWKNPDRILELANLIVCARPGYRVRPNRFQSCYLEAGQALTDFAAGRIAFLDMIPNPCSSTAVRQRLRRKQPVTDCLTPAVLDYITNKHLYGT